MTKNKILFNKIDIFKVLGQNKNWFFNRKRLMDYLKEIIKLIKKSQPKTLK